MKRALVFGAFHFIGFQVVQLLLEKGIEVVGVDLKEVENSTEYQFKLLEIERNANFSYYLCSISDLQQKGIEKDVDVIFYCHDSLSFMSDLNACITNEKRIINALTQSCKEGQQRFIYTSSQEIYGDIQQYNGIIDENTHLKPLTKKGKLVFEIEDLLTNEGKVDRLEFVIIRMPTVYGPWQPKTMTFQHKIDKQLELEPTENPETSPYTADVLFVKDAAYGLYLAAKNKPPSKIFHLGSGKRNQWQEALYEITKAKQDTDHSGESKGPLISIERAENELKFKPHVSIKEGIKLQVDHTKKMMDPLLKGLFEE